MDPSIVHTEKVCMTIGDCHYMYKGCCMHGGTLQYMIAFILVVYKEKVKLPFLRELAYDSQQWSHTPFL